MRAAIAAAEPAEPRRIHLAGGATFGAAGGSTTIYLDPSRDVTIPLAHTSVAAALSTIFLDLKGFTP